MNGRNIFVRTADGEPLDSEHREVIAEWCRAGKDNDALLNQRLAECQRHATARVTREGGRS